MHRVQRVPVTEASGRIHTSTATVAVLPEAEEVDIQVNTEDLRIDTFRAGGHGGQNVQKLETAIRITHLPTGLVVTCQDERSQGQNKIKAMTVLRSRLYEMERQRKEDALSSERRSQVGTGERSEKVRTYNYPQNRVTDHRINFSSHNLEGFLDGDIDDLIDALVQDEREQRLEAALAAPMTPVTVEDLDPNDKETTRWFSPGLSVAEAVRTTAETLQPLSNEAPLEAELLVRHVTGLDRAGIFARSRDALTPGSTMICAASPSAGLTGNRCPTSSASGSFEGSASA